MPRESSRQLAHTMGLLAVEMQGHGSGTDTLRSIVDAAARIVPGARWAGISMIQGRSVVAQVPTDPIVAKLDELQSELGVGPCITALREHHTVLVEDMTTDDRWPEFTQEAAELGVRSMLSFQLFLRSENLGALNLYSTEVAAFSDDSVEIGTIVAQHAAVAMFGSTAEEQFRTALSSRDVIGQAKGILMQQNGISGVQAFAMLTRASTDTNIKLVDVARWLVDQHESQGPILK